MCRKSTRYGKRPAGRTENTCLNSNTHTHKSVQKMVYPGGILKKREKPASTGIELGRAKLTWS